MVQKIIFGAAIILTTSLLFSIAAKADAIDGDWCDKGGRFMSVDGPKVLTPGGNSITAEYDRHAITYTAPRGEKEAGRKIDMRVLDDENAERQVDGGPLKPWHRCQRPSS
jgi:hypothetical protein